jgi:hypothetical protein
MEGLWVLKFFPWELGDEDKFGTFEITNDKK